MVIAEEQPIDIWKIDKKKIEKEKIKKDLDETTEIKIENSVYGMQKNIKNDTIKLDNTLVSKEIKIVGLYDPEEYGLNINLWSNSSGSNLKNIFQNLNKYELSKDAAEF